MRTELLGIHHVTAIAGDPQRNLDFYIGILGLPRERLGTHLTLPPGLEPLRGRIEMLLPRLRLPEAA
jgi:catechol 2,3-dioxygenase-like lactoylglutathione lyase family enzyme